MSKRFNVLLRAVVLSLALSFATHCPGADSIVRAHDMTVARGSTNRLFISLEGAGNENGLGFTLCYDTNHLTLLPPVIRGVAISNSYPTAIFTSDVTAAESNGWVGMFIGLDAGVGETWPAGTNFLVEVLFQAVAGSGSSTTSVAFCDSVIARTLTDTSSNTLAASFINATVLLQGPCAYQLSTNMVTAPFAGSSNTVTVTADANCAWTISNLNSWVTFPDGTNGTGTVANTFHVEANSVPVSRTGLVMLADQVLTIIQEPAPCSYVLTPMSGSHGFGSETGLVNVTANSVCAWEASTSDSWITLSGTNGLGDGTLGYALVVNPNSISRTGTMQIADSIFTITQNGAPCLFTLVPTSASHGFNSETGLVSITGLAGCVWNITNANTWITITSGASGTNDGALGYSVDANASTNERSGVIVIGGENFTVTQAGIPPPCTYEFSPTNVVHGFGAATNSVNLIAGTECAWILENTNTWITITSPTNGTGNSAIDYILATNLSSLERTGVVMVLDQALTIVQHGAPCTYTLTPVQATFDHGTTTNTVDVAMPLDCLWDVINTNAWIKITSPTNGTDSAVVAYEIEANTTVFDRTGVVLIAGEAFTVTQHGVLCMFDVAPLARTHNSGAENNSFAVTTQDGCVWSVGNPNAWITISSALNNTNSGAVDYSLAANPSYVGRTGIVMIAGQAVEVIQTGAPCAYTILPTARIHDYSAVTNIVELTPTADCPWTVVSTNGWITIISATNGTGTTNISYVVDANPFHSWRTGIVSVADQLFTVSQGPAPCFYTLFPTNAAHGAFSEEGMFSVTTSTDCVWTASSPENWIAITSITNDGGVGEVRYAVTTNPAAILRVGTILVADQVFSVTQAPAPCTFTVTPLQQTFTANAAIGSVSVTTLADCNWTATTTNDWLTILSATTNIGSAELSYAAAENLLLTERVGYLFVAGQTLVVTQQATICQYAIAPTSFGHGSGSETGLVTVTTGINCPWQATTTNSWITFAVANGVGNGGLAYAIEANPTAILRTGVVSIEGHDFTITQTGAACSFVLATNSALHDAGEESNSVALTTLEGCVWSVSNGTPWITILSSINNSNSGVVSYSVATNPTALFRTGVLNIGGEIFTVMQAGAECAFVLGANGASYGAQTETNSVTLTTLEGCEWSVSNSTSWIEVLSPPNNTNSGIVTYRVLTNSTALSRTGIVSIAEQSFTVTQFGADCSFQLASNNVSHGAGSETGSVAVVTLVGCAWDVVNSNSWIQIDSATNSTGSGNVLYTVQANTSTSPRSGVVRIAGQNFTINQAGVTCGFSAILPPSATYGPGAGSGSVSVTVLFNCTWTVLNTNDWIEIDSNTINEGSGSISYNVLSNPASFGRSGVVTIAGKDFTVNQGAGSCIFSLTPTNVAHSANSETDSVAVTTLLGCSWGVTNTNSWITITSGTNYTNSGEVSYSLLANATAIPRTGTVSIAGQTLTVRQAGVGCTFALGSLEAAYGSGSETGAVAVITPSGCAWAVSNSTPWITILPPLNHSESESFNYVVDANPTALSRTGVVSVAEQNFRITQAGASCTFTLSATNALHGAGATNSSVSLTTLVGCSWNVVNTNPWIAVLSGTNYTNTGTVLYSVEANPTALVRGGVVTIEGQDFTVTQSGADCTFTIAPENAAYDFAATTRSVVVTTLEGCEWNASSGASWITILTPLNNSNSGSMSYSVAENTTALSRTGIVSVAGHDFTVTQSGAGCSFALATNAAVRGAGLETNSVEVTTLVGCTWSVSNGTPWIEILSPLDNTSSTNVRYRVLANPDALWRTGIVSIAGLDFTVAQSPANCTFTLATNNALHGASAVANSVAVTTPLGCTWSVSNGTPWIHILSSLENSNSSSVTYSVDANPTALTRSGVARIAEQDFTITQAGADCSFDLDSFSASHGSGAENNLIQVTTLIGCAWSVSNVPPWMAINTPLNNTNSGSVSYSVEANPTAIPRAAIIRIAGQDFAVEQDGAGCGFTLTTNSVTYSAGAATNTVGVATLVGCSWIVENSNSWIIIQSPLNNTNDGVVTYRVLTNTTALARVGVVRIAQRNFTITQLGADCTYALETNSASFNFASGSGSVAVTTLIGCTWPVSTATPWITILSSLNNSNSGIVNYSVQSNSTALSRTGLVSIAGHDFTVTQFGAPCSFALATNNATHGSGPATNSFSVTTLVGCTWTPSNGTPWITILSPLNNTNSGTLTYSVATNPTALLRTGVINIQGQNFTVTQNGTTCSFALSSNAASFGFAAGNGSASLSTVQGCAWSVSNSAPWITLLSPANNTNSGSVSFNVESNSTALVRSSVITIADRSFTVTQDGAPCSFTLSSSGAVIGPTSQVSSITVTTLLGCAWSVSSGVPWIQILSNLSNTNGGVVNYSVQSNSTALWRTGIVSIAGQDFTVAQQGAVCSFALGATSAIHGPGEESNSVAVTTLVGCTWSVSNGTPWITILSSLNNSNSGSVNYSVQSNSTALWRTGVVNIAGQNFTVAQAGASCGFVIASNSAAHGAAAFTNSVGIETLLGCTWSVSNGAPWITIQSPLNNTNSGVVTYSGSSNASVFARTGVVNIAGQSFTVTQAAGLTCTLALQSSNWVHRSIAEPGFIGVVGLSDCSWGVTNTNSWITIASGLTVNGGDHVRYWVAANSNSEPRSGVINIGDLAFLLTQGGSGCSYRLSPTNRLHGNGASGSASTINVTAGNGCSWSVINTNDWITIVANASGTGSATVSYTVTKNNGTAPRYGLLNIGGEIMYVTQWGSVCGYSVNPPTRTHGYGMENGTAVLSANPNSTCAWTIVNTNSWITNNAPLSGSTGGNINYTLAANPSGTPRVGIFTVGGAPYIINQAGAPCSYTVTPTNAVHSGTSNTGVVAVATGTGCLWSVLNPNSWISVAALSPTNVTYAVEANPTALTRTGIVNIAGQNVVIVQNGAACTYSLTTYRAFHGYNTELGSVTLNTLVGCPWDVTTPDNWITINPPSQGAGSVTLSYMVATNPAVTGRTGSIAIADQELEVVQAGTPCAFVLSADSASHGAGAESGAVNLSTDPLCNWLAENTNSWITVTNGGTGSRTINYSVAANPTFSIRSGVVVIAGHAFTVTQAPKPCTYVLSPANMSFGSAPAADSISVTASNECSWEVINSNSWIIITSPTVGFGNGTVDYNVLTNGGSFRIGNIFIGGVPFRVSQAGSVRTVRALNMNVQRGQTNRLLIALESTGVENSLGFSLCFDTNHLSFVEAVRGVDATNASSSLNVNAATNFLASGQVGVALGLSAARVFPAGSNVVAEILFRAAAGTTFASTIVQLCDSPILREISDATAHAVSASYTSAVVNILGSCTYALSTNAATIVANGGVGGATVSAQNGCPWTAASSNSWIVITSGLNGSGSGSVNFTVAPNPSGIGRIGTMTIAGIPFTVTQLGQSCTYSISTNVQLHTAAFETGLVRVTSTNGCPWAVINTNPWVHITSLTNNSGSADVTYNVDSNTVAIARTGTVTIAGQSFTINQAAAPCLFAISPTNKVHGFVSETGLVTVTSASGCAWTVDNTNSWIFITSSTNGSGDGYVNYFVTHNPNNIGRTGVVTIASKQFIVSQPLNPCPVTLSPVSRSHGENAETNFFAVTNVAACGWTVSNTNSWIIPSVVSGTGNATVTYRITPNPMLTSRSGIVRISGREFTVTQAAAHCLYGISPTSVTNNSSVQTGVVVVATFSDCDWAVQNTNTWIRFTSATNGTGSANIYYTVTNNPSSVGRTGVVIIANQPFTLFQDGAPCSFTLTPPSVTYGFAGQTNSISIATLTGCVWTASSPDSWIGFQGLTRGTNGGSVTYTVASNATSTTRTGTVNISGQPFSIVQSGVPCTVTLNPTNWAHSYIATTSVFLVTAPVGCAWNATTTNSWITFTNGSSGSGMATVNYVLEANPFPVGRTGVVDVLGKILTVTQPPAPCNYRLDVTNVTESASGLEVRSVYLTNFATCPWTIVNSNTWLVIVNIDGATNGIGSGPIYYLLDPNNSGISRTGNVRIADQVLTIRQLGLPCTFSLSTNNVTHGAVGATNAITVNGAAGCPWTVYNTNNWITFPNGTNYNGGGSLTYWVAANLLVLDRTGTVTVAGQTFTAIQPGITCAYSISPSGATNTSGNVTGLVSVATSGGCTWVVVNTNGWIAIKSGGAGTNGGLVRYTVQANPSPGVRSAYLTVAGNPFLVAQLGSPCSYTLSSTGRLHGSLSETGQVTVLTDNECGWNVLNAASWIHFTSATNGVGTATISYSLDGNTGFGDRTGTFTVGDQVYTITQLGAACNYTFLTNGVMHGALVETGTVYVTMPLGCTYSPGETNSWISILSNSISTNSGTIKYSVTTNTSGAQRIGFITVGSQAFTVTQATVFCSFTVVPTNVLHGFEAETGLISVNTSNPCPWTVLETNTWITINGGTNYTGSNSVSYSLSPNPSSLARTGLVTFAGKVVAIRQAGLVCDYTVTPTNRTHGFLATNSPVTLLCPTLCSWNVIKSNSWITILTPTNNNVGPATVSYSLLRNESATPRTSVITIGGKPFTVTQDGAPFLIASNKTLSCTTPWNFDSPVTSGQCGTPGSNVVVVSTTTNFGCGGAYSATRVWNATDACGNQVFATQAVTVVSAPPLILCAPSKTVECNTGWTFDLPSAIEFCGGTNVTIRVPFADTVTTNGMCGNTKIITRTWEAVDSCSRTSSCSQTVFVVDTTPPVANCPANKTVECGSAWIFDRPTAVDGCSGTNVIIRPFSTVTNSTGTCLYTVTRGWEIFDPCTNRTTCTQIVTVVDNTSPVLTCAPGKTVQSGSTWTFDQPTATDNCTAVPYIEPFTIVTNKTGYCGNTFVATCIWIGFDDCGNSTFCSQTVSVIDTTPPTPACAPGKTVEYGTTWDFDLPTGTDVGGGTNLTVRVVSTTTNTTGFCAPTFSATRTWELSDACSNKVNCSQTVTVRDTTPPSVSCATNKNINCLQAWTFDLPTAVDIASGTNVSIVIMSSVTNGTCGSGFSATRTWRVSDACNNSFVCSQTVFGRGIVNISGTVFCPTNYPATLSEKRLPGAVLLGPTNTTAISGPDGTYSLVFDAASNVTVNAFAPSGEPADGVTTLDISLVRRHILNVVPLDTPYKLIASDVDASGSISTLDLSFMRRLVLGLTNRFPAGLWRFVPANHQFSNPSAPWNAPTNYIYPSASVDIPGQDFIAIKLGDLNNSLGSSLVGKAAHAAAKSGTPVVSFQASNVTTAPGTSVVVHVTVRDFNRVTTAQGTLAWNPAVLRFVGTEQYGLDGLASGNFGKTLTPEGRLSFSWDDPNVQGVTAPDGSVMFAVRFDVIGSPGSISPLAFVDSIALCEASVDFVPCTFRALHGQLNVSDPNGLRLNPTAIMSTSFGVAVPTVGGKNYILEYTESLSEAQWIALPPVPGDGTVKTLSDPSPKSQQRFYRLKVE